MRNDRGFTLIELLIVVAIIGIVASIAVPGLLRARIAGNEASAIGSMRTVNSSEQAFSASCGNGYYAASFPDLRGPLLGGPPFISPDLSAAAPSKSGYGFELVGGTDAIAGTLPACNGVLGPQLVSGYVSRADPDAVGGTGVRHFWTNTLGTIYFDPSATIGHTEGATAPALSSPAGPLQ